MDVVEAVKKEAGRNGRGLVPAKKKCIAVLTPTLGIVSMWWHSAMLDLVWPMNCGKSFIPTQDLVGGEVGEMRNKLVAMALSFEEGQGIDLESIFWVDDDVVISRLALLTLAAHDTDIASGVYFAKEGHEPLIFAGPSSGTLKFQPDKVFEAWGWSQGLSLIRTSVFKRMRDDLDLGTDKYGNPQWYKKPDFGMDDSGQLTLGGTEDFHFFENASRLDYRPVIDCTKHAFGWHYDLGKKTGYPLRQWNQYLRREPIVWQTREGEVVWD